MGGGDDLTVFPPNTFTISGENVSQTPVALENEVCRRPGCGSRPGVVLSVKKRGICKYLRVQLGLSKVIIKT